MNPLDNLTRDVSLALALLLDNQDKWDPRFTFKVDEPNVSAEVEVPLTLIPWVRS